jgi:decaprenylphospho-beta-D-erythro-pentofuranosid-2-ulose 2-reductase
MSVASATTARKVILLGGTSEIGLAIVERLRADAGCELALVGRDHDRLEQEAGRLRAAGGGDVIVFELDARSTDRHEEVLETASDRLGGADVVVVAVGVLGDRGGTPDDVAAAVDVMAVNAVGTGSLLINSAKILQKRGGGTVVVLSSVAAERPRRANLVYGASKAALDFLARGLGDDLEDDGVRVLVVRPGFVHTRMTRGLQPPPLASTPEQVAVATVAALDGRSRVVWVPRQLRWLMLVMRSLPRPLFRRIRR